MVNKKRVFILLFCFLVWGFIFFYLVIDENVKARRSVTQYVLINPYNYWEFTDLKWKKIDSILDFDYVDKYLNWKKFDVYQKNDYYNTFEFVYRKGNEYFFDNDSHSHEINQEKILFNKGSYFKLVDFDEDVFNDTDLSVVDSFLKKYNYSVAGLTVQKKYVINDDECLYIVSNYSSSFTNNTDNLFYVAFYRNGNNNYLLFKLGYVEDLSSYRLAWVLNIQDKKYNFILSYNYGEGKIYDMYQYVKGKYVKVIGTSEE